MRARILGIVLDTAGLGIVCVLLAVLASEMPVGWQIVAISMLSLASVALIVSWGQYQHSMRRQALDCRYIAMIERIHITSRDPWPRTLQLMERHVFGGQTIRRNRQSR